MASKSARGAGIRLSLQTKVEIAPTWQRQPTDRHPMPAHHQRLRVRRDAELVHRLPTIRVFRSIRVHASDRDGPTLGSTSFGPLR